MSGGSVERIGPLSMQLAQRFAWVTLPGGGEAVIYPQRAGDSVNLHRMAFDGSTSIVTQGTGIESWPLVLPSGDVIFTRMDQTPSIWSVPIAGDRHTPVREVSNARTFGTSADGSRLVFGRMLGTEQGQIVLRDRDGTESVLAAHKVFGAGTGSLWPQVSPDGTRVIYRAQQGQGPNHYVVATDGGTARPVPREMLGLASDWSRDGSRVIGECTQLESICEYFPQNETGRRILTDPSGAELLYPTFSWDGGWVAFMRRLEGRTRILVTPVREDGLLAGSDAWITISSEAADGARPRFGPDGATLFYLQTRAGITTLVRQQLDRNTKRPIGALTEIAGVQNIPQSVFYIGLQNVLTVTRDRLFFNTAEVRSNVWMTRLE